MKPSSGDNQKRLTQIETAVSILPMVLGVVLGGAVGGACGGGAGAICFEIFKRNHSTPIKYALVLAAYVGAAVAYLTILFLLMMLFPGLFQR